MTRTLLAIAVCLAIPASSSAKTYDIADISKAAVTKVKRSVDIDVLLPDQLALDYSGRLYMNPSTFDEGYDITFGAVRNCGASVCSLGNVEGMPGGRLAFRDRVKLANGSTASFKGLTCGASCSPPTIDFRVKGVRYSIQAKLETPSDKVARRRLIAAAEEAIEAGPR
ncbi:MAG: hypothetical protein H0V29_06845 [Thermoleophilaceae bacterium]|nr:hypothetical protein [Thermoleophilaceae bacterium]